MRSIIRDHGIHMHVTIFPFVVRKCDFWQQMSERKKKSNAERNCFSMRLTSEINDQCPMTHMYSQNLPLVHVQVRISLIFRRYPTVNSVFMEIFCQKSPFICKSVNIREARKKNSQCRNHCESWAESSRVDKFNNLKYSSSINDVCLVFFLLFFFWLTVSNVIATTD